MTDRVLVVVPTYNEVENLEPILERLHASVPGAHALVVDDGSPDGTGELAEKLAARDERVHVLRRSAQRVNRLPARESRRRCTGQSVTAPPATYREPSARSAAARAPSRSGSCSGACDPSASISTRTS